METGIVFDQIVGAVLVHFRTKIAKLNQQEAVKGIPIGVSSLSRLEKGDYSLTMDQLLVLSQRYQVPMSDIVNSVEATYDNSRLNGVPVTKEKKSKSGLLLLGATAVAALVIATK